MHFAWRCARADLHKDIVSTPLRNDAFTLSSSISFHRNAAPEAPILALAEQAIFVFRLGRLFAFKERRRIPEERSDRIL